MTAAVLAVFGYVIALGFLAFGLFVVVPAVLVFLFAMPFWLLEIAAAIFGKSKK